jgi:hypothetical protein
MATKTKSPSLASLGRTVDAGDCGGGGNMSIANRIREKLRWPPITYDDALKIMRIEAIGIMVAEGRDLQEQLLKAEKEMTGTMRDRVPYEIHVLYRTAGSCPWLDNLTDEQWQTIKRDILPVLQREDERRCQ